MTSVTWTRRAKLAWSVRHWRHRVLDSLANKIAYALPARVVYHAGIRMGAYATVGKYSGQIVPELILLEAAKRWGDDKIPKPY